MPTLPAKLTQAQATACLGALWAALQAQDQTEAAQLDASELVQFDSAALAVILELQRRCQDRGKRLQIKGLSAQMTNLATLYGIESLLVPA